MDLLFNMGDGDTANVQQPFKVKTTVQNKVTLSKRQHLNRNTFRRVRKNRSKIRYYKSLKQLRYNRKTDDLCSAVEVFDISDMDCIPTRSSTDLPPDVTEWQKQEQIAYWKSRAISLELENKMLHQHLRNVYAKTIEEHIQYNERTEMQNGKVENLLDEKNCSKKDFREKSGMLSNTKRPVSPKEPVGKNRLEEMKNIYGDDAQKIMGMETALQLKYEKLSNQSKPSYWPTIPLNL